MTPIATAHLPAVAAANPSVHFECYPIDALMRITQRPSRVITRGRGSWLWDSQGRAYLDLVQGWAVSVLGHSPPALAQALATQADLLLQPGPGLHNDRALLLAQRLTSLSGLGQAFFTSSGAEANEGAIKLARKFGQRRRGGAFEIITFENAFHGRTLATMSASGKPGFLTEVRARGEQLRAGLNTIATRIGSPPVSGRGLLLALDLPRSCPASALANVLRERASDDGQRPGLLVNAVRAHRLRFVPALNITADEVALALAMLEEAV